MISGARIFSKKDFCPCLANETSGVTAIVFGVLTLSQSRAQQALAAAHADADSTDTNRQIADLTALVQKLQSKVNNLEEKLKTTERSNPAAATVPAAASNPVSGTPSRSEQGPPPATPEIERNILRGTTVNLLFDGYYGYNFNNPIGRVNLLRAYDVSSNAFSLNRAALAIENVPDLAIGKRYGLRLDLQYGQADSDTAG
jgi:hypothetical protein